MMQNSLLLHPHTKENLDRFMANPSHGLLITGPLGSGKTSTAIWLASKLMNKDKDAQSNPYFMHIIRQKNKQDITIEQVRSLISALKLTVPGRESVRRVAFIEDAQYLSIPAQNALLKALEEPASETVFILSASSERSVLPTISSRLQQIDIKPVSLESAQKFWPDYPNSTIESAWRLSRGAPGLLYSLLSGEEHPLKSAVEEIKVYLRSTKFERILYIDKLSRSRENFNYFLDALARTLAVLHHQAINKNQIKQSKVLLFSRKHTYEAQKALNANVNSRLVALNLSLKLNI
jgi:DNA polymerase-3 subunit delta'